MSNYVPNYPDPEPRIDRPFWGLGWPVRNPKKKEILTELAEYEGQKHAYVACTQLAPQFSAKEQKRILREWCAFLSSQAGIEELAFCSRVPVELFEAACEHKTLKRMHVKWGPVSDLSPLRKRKQLEGLSMGGSSVEDISPLGELPKLKMLYLNKFGKVGDFSALGGVKSLEYLAITGDIYAPKKIHIANLSFLGRLSRLRALMLDCVIVDRFEIEPLRGALKKLGYFHTDSLKPSQAEQVRAVLEHVQHFEVI